MVHYVFFALELLFAAVVITWGVLTLRRMKRRSKKDGDQK
jgi:hypothetical protein